MGGITMTRTIILEQGDGEIWGRLTHNNCFHVAAALTTEGVIADMRQQIECDMCNVDVKYRTVWDMSQTFENAKSLKIEAIAQEAKINPSLMRQYAAGIKFVSRLRYEKIMAAIRRIGAKLIILE